MSLDLSAVTDAAKLSQVDMAADSAANSVKLTLADVLGQQAPVDNAAVHQLKVTGDINDTTVFNTNEWSNTGHLVADNGHSYAVYNAANNAAVQLLIDQQMMVHNA